MKKNIWIWNHYATYMFFNRGGRHYWFAENLIPKGYEVTIFCANTRHNTEDAIKIRDGKFTIETADRIPFVFVKTTAYDDNGLQRIRNMVTFYRNLFPVAKEYAKSNGKPDIIFASSVHPLTLVAGIKIAKIFGVPCICEVRDLWPESIIAYGALKKKSLITKILYQGEKWIYKKADYVIMTWEGGKDYVIDQGWTKQVDVAKIKHISNGVAIDSFDRNSVENQITDLDLDNQEYKNIVYAGSIRKVNNLGMLLDSAKIIQNQGIDNIRFLIYGAGNECKSLEDRCKEENITNVIFKGFVEKKYVPYILKKAYLNILHYSSTSLDKYGQSQNKLFEYLAAGRGIIQTYSPGYSICNRANCGIIVPIQNAEEIAKAVIRACSDDVKCQMMGENARKVAYEFDFKRLTEKLIEIIESASRRGVPK